MMYRQITLPERDILLDCMAICFLEIESKCTVLAVRSPICYLGDQVGANSATSNDKNVTIFVADGNFLLFVNVLPQQHTDVV